MLLRTIVYGIRAATIISKELKLDIQSSINNSTTKYLTKDGQEQIQIERQRRERYNISDNELRRWQQEQRDAKQKPSKYSDITIIKYCVHQYFLSLQFFLL